MTISSVGIILDNDDVKALGYTHEQMHKMFRKCDSIFINDIEYYIKDIHSFGGHRNMSYTYYLYRVKRMPINSSENCIEQFYSRFKIGDEVKHFKSEMCSHEADPRMYHYRILNVAWHTETNEPMVIYEALYGSHEVYVRPMDMFVSEVDHIKYPNVKQKYRLEVVSNEQ